MPALTHDGSNDLDRTVTRAGDVQDIGRGWVADQAGLQVWTESVKVGGSGEFYDDMRGGHS